MSQFIPDNNSTSEYTLYTDFDSVYDISLISDEDEQCQVTNGVSLAWKNVSYTMTDSKTKQKTDIIHNLSGIVKPGEVMAIMGPSGAGKSTLLDVLAGRKDPKLTSGKIYLNGNEGPVKYISTYVMQDDALMGALTVRENIQFAADLCFPKSYSVAERKAYVQATITEFGLEHVADSKIGTIFMRGISGDEKRRAAIASQVINLPKIIFLNEPTTGLDSAASYNVMKAIVHMARSHKLIVIASIHQPSTDTYSLFDKLCILGRGRNLYMGSRKKTISYFRDLGHMVPAYSNPADYFLHLINSDFITDNTQVEKIVDDCIDAFERSSNNKQIQDEIHLLKKHELNFFDQTRILLRRAFINASRNVLMYWIRVIMYAALGLLLGSTFWQIGYRQINIIERLSSQYFAVAFLTFMAIAGIPGYLEERLVFQRERGNGFYSVGPYVLANIIVSIPFLLLISFSFTAVFYPTVGLNSGSKNVFMFIIYLFLTLNVAESIVIFIASIIPIFVAVLAINSFANGVLMTFGGYLVRPNSISKIWKWLYYADYQTYAFQAIIFNDMKGLVFECEKLTFLNLETNEMSYQYNCHYGDKTGQFGSFTGESVLADFGYEDISPTVSAVSFNDRTVDLLKNWVKY
ncbi:9921_t:CDS:2 [Ambispora gerdemannii]|uniref:9921_t:CDS:1 n=1 Tax=Ambispora gerdemannii TaxID=144530 RepID=A0A9N9CGG7_9GLOM|nr:9921_t:CDS:2 [Ambispora gerdemannii]